MRKKIYGRPVMTLREVQVVLGVSYPTVRKWVIEEKLPSVKIADKRFVLRRPFFAMLMPNPERPAA